MPRTNTDKIETLQNLYGELTRRNDILQADCVRLIDRVQLLERQIDPLRIENAVLQREVAELKKAGDEWGRRLWGLVQILIGATVGAAFTYLLKR